MSLCYTSTSEASHKNEEPRVLRLGRISASAFIEKSETCTMVGSLKRVALCDTRGHDSTD